MPNHLSHSPSTLPTMSSSLQKCSVWNKQKPGCGRRREESPRTLVYRGHLLKRLNFSFSHQLLFKHVSHNLSKQWISFTFFSLLPSFHLFHLRHPSSEISQVKICFQSAYENCLWFSPSLNFSSLGIPCLGGNWREFTKSSTAFTHSSTGKSVSTTLKWRKIRCLFWEILFFFKLQLHFIIRIYLQTKSLVLKDCTYRS